MNQTMITGIHWQKMMMLPQLVVIIMMMNMFKLRPTNSLKLELETPTGTHGYN